MNWADWDHKIAKRQTYGPSHTTNRKPIHGIRMGRIKAAIWQNETDNGIRYNVTVGRLYKDGETWKQTESFGRDDLPLRQSRRPSSQLHLPSRSGQP